MSTKFRDSIRELSPRWLQGFLGERLLYSLLVHLDLLGDAAVDAVKRRWPGEASDSLPLIGRDRKIRRGPNEPDDSYVTRLQNWREDHRRRGGPYALLSQLYGYYISDPRVTDLIYRSGMRFHMDLAGVITRDPSQISLGETEEWALWFLVIQLPAGSGLQDDGLWGDPGGWEATNFVWGSNLTVQEVNDLLTVPVEWNNAHSNGRIWLLGDGGQVWGFPDPTALWGADGGNWGDGAEVLIRVPNP